MESSAESAPPTPAAAPPSGSPTPVLHRQDVIPPVALPPHAQIRALLHELEYQYTGSQLEQELLHDLAPELTFKQLLCLFKGIR